MTLLLSIIKYKEPLGFFSFYNLIVLSLLNLIVNIESVVRGVRMVHWYRMGGGVQIMTCMYM